MSDDTDIFSPGPVRNAVSFQPHEEQILRESLRRGEKLTHAFAASTKVTVDNRVYPLDISLLFSGSRLMILFSSALRPSNRGLGFEPQGSAELWTFPYHNILSWSMVLDLPPIRAATMVHSSSRVPGAGSTDQREHSRAGTLSIFIPQEIIDQGDNARFRPTKGLSVYLEDGVAQAEAVLAQRVRPRK